MSDNYWAGALATRVSRRRGLQATGAGALGAAFLAACGGSDDKTGGGTKQEEPKKSASSLLFQPTDTTKNAVKGGIWQSFVPSEPQGFDRTAATTLRFSIPCTPTSVCCRISRASPAGSPQTVR
jgi:hypothetical protein